MSRPEAAGIVLAAGVSRRMGCDKLFLEVRGAPLIRLAVERALKAELRPVVVVAGRQGDRIRTALGGLPHRLVSNPRPGGPISGSLHRGLDALGADVEGAVVTLADMPLVDAPMLGRLVAEAARHGASLVASRYGGTVAPPFFFHRSVFPILRRTAGPGLGRRLADQCPESSTIVDWPAERLLDIDTPADLEAVRTRLGDSAAGSGGGGVAETRPPPPRRAP